MLINVAIFLLVEYVHFCQKRW